MPLAGGNVLMNSVLRMTVPMVNATADPQIPPMKFVTALMTTAYLGDSCLVTMRVATELAELFIPAVYISITRATESTVRRGMV